MNSQIDRMYEHYHKVLYACLQSGKWDMSAAKKEALCSVRNFYKDNDEIQSAIMDTIKASIQPTAEETTGEE